MQSPDGNQLWCPGQSLWSLIAEHAPESQLPKIHTALGSSLVCAYKDVHTEAERWHKMWQESHQGSSWSRAGTPLPRQRAPLADPPAVKELVRAEVKMLLQTLRERAGEKGRDGDELLIRYKPETVNYALSHLDSCYRNFTNPADSVNESRPSSRCSVQSHAEDEVEAMRDKLNVADIEQVVERLRCVLMEECEALKKLVKHIQGNIIQKCQSRCESDKSEPSLAELRELRGAIQMDLELYPSSLAASASASSLLPLKESENRFRLLAGRRVSDDTPQALSATSALRPHPPPPPLCHTNPRPPPGAPPSKASASVKLVNSSSLSRTHRHYRSTSASTGPEKTQTPICNRIATYGEACSQFTTSLPGPDSEQMMLHHCSLSPGQDLLCRTPTSPRNSPIHETHLSSHRSRNSDVSPQLERKSSPLWRSRNISTIPSTPHCEAGSYSSNSTDHSVSTTGRSKTHNGRQNSTSECVHSCVGIGKSNSGADTNKNGHPGKDVTQQQSQRATCTHPASVRINGRLFTSPKRPLEGTTSQPKSVQETQIELEFINKCHQPVPPARVST